MVGGAAAWPRPRPPPAGPGPWRRCRWPLSSTASSSWTGRRRLRPAKLWNDTESAPEAARMVEALGAATLGGPDGLGAGGRLHRHQAGLAGPPRAGRRPGGAVGAAAPRLPDLPADRSAGDRPGRRLGHRLLRPRRRGSGWSTCWTRWWDRPTGPTACPTVLGPTEAAGPLGRRRARRTSTSGASAWWARGPGDNMAAALGLGLAPGQAVRLPRHLGHRLRPQRPVRWPTRPAAVAGFADATGGYLPLACTLNATRVTDAVARPARGRRRPTSTTWPWRARPGRRGSPSCPTSTASGPPTGPAPPARSPACAPTSPGRGPGPSRLRGGGLRTARRPGRPGGLGGGRTTARWWWSAAAPGRRPTAGRSPTCRAGRCWCRTVDEAVATGAVRAGGGRAVRPVARRGPGGLGARRGHRRSSRTRPSTPPPSGPPTPRCGAERPCRPGPDAGRTPGSR